MKHNHSKGKSMPIIIFIFLLSITFNIYAQSPFQLKKVVIDAGHGGHDTGCHGDFAYEKNVTLSIALKLGALIKANHPDVKVIYTRDADFFVELKERANIANRNNADLFISVHCNANPKEAPYGTETYLMGLHKADDNLEVSKRENNVVILEENYNSNYDGFDPNSAESQIIFSLYQNAFIDQSILLAQSIEDAYSARGRYSRGVKQAGFLVLWRTAMPSILTETGFLTNSSEESFMKTEEGQQEIAECIYSGFRTYKEKMESSPNANPQINNPKGSLSSPVDDNRASIENINSPYTFRVQINASKDSVPNRYDGLPDLYIDQAFENYRYMSGKFKQYLDAETYLAKMKYDGFKNAFIVVYKNNKRITYAQYNSELQTN